jgi:regulatory protein
MTLKEKQQVPEWILSKMKHFCAYQERCMQDVTTRLSTFHLQEDVYESIINILIKENFLNEERFARSFARGKLKYNKWGKNKIYATLQLKGVPEIFIEEALNEIDPHEYITVLRNLVAAKSKEIKETEFNRKIKKLANFATSKGFESDLVWDVLNFRD